MIFFYDYVLSTETRQTVREGANWSCDYLNLFKMVHIPRV